MKHYLSTIIKGMSVALLAVVLNLGILTTVVAQINVQSNQDDSTLIAQATPIDPIEEATEGETPQTAQTNAQGGQLTVPAQVTTCESSFVGLGWLLCQVTRAIYGAFDWLVQEVLAEDLLEIDLIEDNEELRNTWEGFKYLANWVFAIVFMVIIYAEATGRIGALETFSVTKLLPRLVFAVVGLQISYFIVGYTIAFFNDIGAGVTQLVLSPVDGLSNFELRGIFQPLTDDATFWGIPIDGAGDFLDNLVAAPAIAAIGIAAIVFLPTLLMFGGLGLILLLLTLIARKIIIIALVILSPFAFALFVLPSTEKYFKQWWDIFLKTLMMYPLIMIFIASGNLLGRLAVSGDDVSFIDSVIGFVATFLPFFLIPLTFRLAGNAVTAIAGGLGNMNEKIKGDTRDPNSPRSILRQKRGQRYGRLMSGDARIPMTKKSILPRGVRRAYNRIPGTDSSAPLIDDIVNGRKTVEGVTSTLGDEVIRAAAVTGGGIRVGRKIKVSDGSGGYAYARSGFAQLGKHLAYNSDGSLITDGAGAARLRNNDGSLGGTATTGDFYDKDIISEVKKYSGNRGFLHASSEYAMTKAVTQRDQSQVWEGLDASKWTKDEKETIANSVWYATKNDQLQHKFGDFGNYFHDGSYDVPADNRNMSLKFSKLTEYVDQNIDTYSLSKQKGAFWSSVQGGLQDLATEKGITPNMSRDEIVRKIGEKQYNEINNLVWKSNNFINSKRNQRVQDPDGDGEVVGQMAGSQSVGQAAREAEAFLQVYRDTFGKLPGTSGIENDLLGD